MCRAERKEIEGTEVTIAGRKCRIEGKERGRKYINSEHIFGRTSKRFIQGDRSIFETPNGPFANSAG